MNDQLTPYRAPYVTAPGVTLAELLDERGVTQAELARRMNRPVNAVNEILSGSKEITEDTALELERVLGAPAHFWLSREARYREHLARQRDDALVDSRVHWLETLPLKALQDGGYLPQGRLTSAFKRTLVEPALKFFGVASPEGWEEHYNRLSVSFRRANPKKQTDSAAIKAWLRIGEIQASGLQLPEYDAGLLRAKLPAMRALTTQSAVIVNAQLKLLCKQAGVALLFVPPFTGTHVSGVARWFADRPVIQLSLLGKWSDAFWFSFFHEVGHVLLHGKKAVFLDDATDGSATESVEEREANAFAANTLISTTDRVRMHALPVRAAEVKSFAHSIGVHPGIVVGALLHDKKIGFGHPICNLRGRYDIAAKPGATQTRRAA
jgi:HTH-type transcriptional regulator / antitoxin HigA